MALFCLTLGTLLDFSMQLKPFLHVSIDGYCKSIINKKATPVFVKPEEHAVNQLTNVGILPEDVKYIVISHFHGIFHFPLFIIKTGDHICGLKDFPNAKFVYLQESYATLSKLSSFSKASHAFLPGYQFVHFLIRRAYSK